MAIIKLTTAWGHPFLKNQLNPQLKQHRFEIDNNCDECDYWIIWGDLPLGVEKMIVKCPTENILYMTDEVHERKTFVQSFLDQFPHILTCRDDLSHKHLIRTPEINHWHLNKTFQDLYHTNKISKTKKLSVVCSDLTLLIGHKKRYGFVNKMIGHFKDQIDVFGRGFNPIDDKWEALAPYKYSIAIENSMVNGYFTEKLTECYLAQTFPIYYGAPDIATYYDPNSMLQIDINDYKNAILKIEHLLETDPWEKSQDLIIEQKNKYLENLHLFPALAKIIDSLRINEKSIIRKNKIYGHETFSSYYVIRKFWNMHKHLIYR